MNIYVVKYPQTYRDNKRNIQHLSINLSTGKLYFPASTQTLEIILYIYVYFLLSNNFLNVVKYSV